jgi:polyferredoxin
MERRKAMAHKSRIKFNVLDIKPVHWILRSSLFPVAFQIISLIGILWLAANGLGIGAGMRSDELITLRKTNLTTLGIWGLWWPAMIAIALTLGRAWCTVCPMEMVNRVGAAIARRIGLSRARLGKFLRAGWLILAAYLALQLLVAGFSIHRVPHYTSIFLLVLLGSALITGLVFKEKRSFCRAFCPAGALLSVYGRYTPLQLEACDPSICDSCPTKDCVRAENRERFDKRSCPSLLTPFRRQASDGCVLCFQCAKVCPYENMGWGLTAPEAPVRQKALLRPFEAAFVMVALGFVSHEVIGEVKWLEEIFHVAPEWLNGWMPNIPFGWVEGLWFLAIFPAVVWAAISGLSYIMGYRSNVKSLLLAAATGAAPVVAVAHLAKAAAKVSSWGGFLPLAAHDPKGIETLQRLTENTLSAPTSLIGLSIVGWAMLVLSLAIAWKAWRWSRHVPAQYLAAARTGLTGTAVLFGIVLTIWAWPI